MSLKVAFMVNYARADIYDPFSRPRLTPEIQLFFLHVLQPAFMKHNPYHRLEKRKKLIKRQISQIYNG